MMSKLTRISLPFRVFLTAILCVAAFAPRAVAQNVDPCDAFSGIGSAFTQFQVTFNTTNDLDADGLHDPASFALMDAVACNALASASMTNALFNAYNINLAIFDGEAAAADLADYRDLISILMAISDAQEPAIKTILGAANPPITLTGDYVPVTCSGADCVPAAIVRVSITEEFEVFADSVRATNEPFSATGDLDADGTDNVTEFNNVDAQGGAIEDFVIAATSANLNGTEQIRSPGGGGGGCFIATAAFGSPLANEIDVLRTVRDRYLMPNAIGAIFADTYYRVSPPIAGVVAEHPGLASFTRALLTPVVAVFALRMNQTYWLVGGLTMLGIFVARRRGARRKQVGVNAKSRG